MLEDAFDQLLTWAKIPPARRPALAARLGWPDGKRRTLQEAADMVGVTRERVRQIQHKFEGRVRGRVLLPALQQAVASVRAHVPATAEEAIQILLDRGLSRGPVHPGALAELARVLGVEPGFEVVPVPGFGAAVVAPGTGGRVEDLRRLAARVKRAARPYGFVHVDLVRSLLPPALAGPATAELVLRALGAESLEAGWYHVVTDRREPAARLIEDMLAVAGGTLAAAEIRGGFERRLRYRAAAGHRYQEGWCPSTEAVLAFCRSRPRRFRVVGDVVSSTQPLDFRHRLEGVERTMVEVLLDAPGRVLRREDFEREVLSRGVNANTFGIYTSYSPFLKDLGGGLWAARGVEPDPVEVEHLLRHRPARRGQVEEWRWLADGALRVTVRLDRVTSLVVSVPSAVRPYLAGRAFAMTAGGEVTDAVVRVNEDGASWGYGPALAYLRAQVGDVMLADFYLVAGTVRLSLVRSGEERGRDGG